MAKYTWITRREELLTYLNPVYRASIINDSEVIPDNMASFNTTYGALRINDASTSSKGTLDIPVGYMQIGDRVDVELEIMNVKGVKAKVALDSYVDNRYASIISNIGITQSQQVGQFETFKSSFVASGNAYMMLVIGTFTADFGDFYVRNIKIKRHNSKSAVKYQTATRFYTINGSSNGFYITGNSPDKCLIEVDAATKRIKITHENPFSYTAYPGLVLGDISAHTNHSKLKARFRTETSNAYFVEIYDINGVQIDPMTLQNDATFYIKMVHHAYEFINQ